MARALHPGFASDMMRYVGAANGNVAMVAGQATTATASDTIVTGLATVAGAIACYDTDPADANCYVSCSIGDQNGTPAAGSILLKTWQNTSGTDPTPAAAGSFSKKVNWLAWGTPVAS